MSLRIKANIPNAITSLNLLSGAAACICAFRYQEPMGALLGYQWAFVLIAAAAVFDFMDGAMARLLHVYSLLGKELDSLSDLVSFGLAPAMLVYNTMSDGGFQTTPWAYAALFIALCGALRLARFNVDTRQTTSFIGLPIPANALFWIGAVAWVQTHGYPGHWIAVVAIVAVSLLMVSGLKMFSLKFTSFGFMANRFRYLLLISAVILLVVCGVPGLMWTIILYLLMSLTAGERR